MSDDGGESERNWTKQERLVVAGAIAPYLRESKEKTKNRRVAVTDKDGKILRYTTLDEVQKKLLEAHALEIDVIDGERPKEVICELCGKFVKVEKGKGGPIPRFCKDKRCQHKPCPGFGETEGECRALPPVSAFEPGTISRRKGEPWMCKLCTSRKNAASPERRKKLVERMLKLHKNSDVQTKRRLSIKKRAQDPEYRKRQAKANRERSQTPEWRKKNAEAARKCAQDPEWRRNVTEANRKMHKDPEYQKKNKEALRKLHKDPELRKKHAEACKDPEYRKKQSEAQRKRHKDPEYRKKHAETMRKNAQGPEWRKKQLEAVRKAAQDPEWKKKNREHMKQARLALKKKREAAKKEAEVAE